MKILVEINVGYHGEFALDNFGPCSTDEVFFPRAEHSTQGIGSCFKIKPEGKVQFKDVNDVCLDSSGKGSLRSSFSKRDPETKLLLGALDFLHNTRSEPDFIPAKERVWYGFYLPNAHYVYPMFYSDGTSLVPSDIETENFPSFSSMYFSEYSEELQMKLRYPSSNCFARSWGNDTSQIIITEYMSSSYKSKIVCKGLYGIICMIELYDCYQKFQEEFVYLILPLIVLLVCV